MSLSLQRQMFRVVHVSVNHGTLSFLELFVEHDDIGIINKYIYPFLCALIDISFLIFHVSTT